MNVRLSLPGTAPPHRGATMIELLIVIAIIAIMAASFLPNLRLAEIRSRVGRCSQDMQLLADRLDAYLVDQGDLPPNEPEAWGPGKAKIAGAQTADVSIQKASLPALGRLTTPVAYVGQLPEDRFQDEPGDGFAYWRLEGADAAGMPGVRAILLSPGPDGVWNSSRTSGTLNLVLYDSTNGTVSSGDLVLTIPFQPGHSNVSGEAPE